MPSTKEHILKAISEHQRVRSAIAEHQKPKVQDSIIELLSLLSPLSDEDKKLRMAKFKVDPDHATFETLQELLPIIHQFLSSRELANGKDGVTPIKGKDYFTDEDKKVLIAEMTRVPKKGVDYFTKEEIRQFIKEAKPIKGIHYFDGRTPIKGQDYRDGKDGRNGRDGKDADIAVIRGITKELLKQQLPSMLTEKDIEKILSNKKFSAKQISDLEVRLNTLRADVMRNYGGHGMSIHKEIVGEVVAGSGTTFTLANTPTLLRAVLAQGQRLSQSRNDYTISGKVIATAGTWKAGDIEADYYT